jgi:hypothetical protein
MSQVDTLMLRVGYLGAGANLEEEKEEKKKQHTVIFLTVS